MSIPAGALHELVRGYLLHYGYADTLVAFDAAAGSVGITQPMAVDGDAVACSLALRRDARRALLTGDVDGAGAVLQAQLPVLLEGRKPFAQRAVFLMSCQKYIELIRCVGVACTALLEAYSVYAGPHHNDFAKLAAPHGLCALCSTVHAAGQAVCKGCVFPSPRTSC